METVKDKQILTAIAELTASAGYPPTFRELSDKIGLNCTTTFERVKGLREAGLLVPSDKGIMDKESSHEDSVTTPRQTGTKMRILRLTEAGWKQIGQPVIPLSALPRVRHLPVFHSSEALVRYLAMPAVRNMVAAPAALAAQNVRIIPIAELRSEADTRLRASQKPSLVFDGNTGRLLPKPGGLQ